MKKRKFITGMALMSALLGIAPLLAGCGSFWNSSTTSTTITLTASTTKPVEGATVTLTATVSPIAAAGTVTFYDGTTSLGTATLSSGTATLTASFSTTGAHSITAAYEGSTTYGASTSSAVTLTCTAASLTSTTTALAVSSAAPATGQDVTLTATLSPSTATGTVTLYEGTTSLGSATLSSGSASLTTSFTTPGTYSLTAVYSGDSTDASSVSPAVSVTATTSSSLTATATALASSSYSTTAGSTFTLTATVAIASTGDTATAATGTVEFYDTTTSTELGVASLSSGIATLSTSLSVAETHVISGIYAGDSTYATSTSSTVSVVVAASTTSTSTIALSVSPSTVTASTGVALAAIVTPVSSTGTVTFYDGSTEIGTADLVSGSAVAALTTTGLAVGSHSITAHYSSLTSSSAAVTVTTATAGSFTSAASCGYTKDGATGANVLSSGTLITSGKSYSTSTSDQNAICVTGAAAYLTLLDPAIASTSATMVDGDSSWYGLDAAVLDYNGGVLTIDGGTITSSGDGGNLVYSYGTGTVTISNATISATSSSASNGHGIYASGAGTIVANNVTASSKGPARSIVAADNGGGTVTINGGSYSAAGSKSAGIYSTGTIVANNATFTTGKGEGVVIEGSNIAKLYNTTLNVASSEENRGIFLYQSMSGDATNNDCGTTGDCFLMTGGALNFTNTTSGNTDPTSNCAAFAVANQTSIVTLTDVSINNSCATLLLAAENPNWEYGGGKVTFIAKGTALTGNVIVKNPTISSDDSTAILTLESDSSGSGSTLTGAINSANSGSSKVTLTLDASSKWVVSGNSYLTTLTDADATYSNITCQTAGCAVHVGTSTVSPTIK